MSRSTERLIADLFAGPGGWDMAAWILSFPDVYGFDIDADACATARAAGFLRTQADVRSLNPADFRDTRMAIISSPCPTFSRGGKRTGVTGNDPEIISTGICSLGDSEVGLRSDDDYATAYDRVRDPRTALILENLRFALRMPNVRWVVAEQVPAARPVWMEMAAELAIAGYRSCHVVTVHGEDLGLPSRRSRAFLLATRHHTPDLIADLPVREHWSCGLIDPPTVHLAAAEPLLPPISMAMALGWPSGERINTRGQRRTSGGNEFSADRPAWCLTEKARSWRRVSDGRQLTESEAGLLNGFPADHPWQGSRSKRFLQIADVVAPPVAAAVLATAMEIPWRERVREYLEGIYPAGVAVPVGVQGSLFAVHQ
ncbi:DNA cytosine methyltransferase [Streptosporangium sp. NPDC051023]|uniref:DNA cytosine methyltransferase n=1 Tax=Streptosporangium sp. NPDC051023 TaxID=3155410 RepID=UPI0034506715